MAHFDETGLRVKGQTQTFAQTAQDLRLEGASLSGISHTYVEIDQYTQAVTAAERSRQLRRTIGSIYEPLALNNLGITNALQGKFAPASENYDLIVDR